MHHRGREGGGLPAADAWRQVQKVTDGRFGASSGLVEEFANSRGDGAVGSLWMFEVAILSLDAAALTKIKVTDSLRLAC